MKQKMEIPIAGINSAFDAGNTQGGVWAAPQYVEVPQTGNPVLGGVAAVPMMPENNINRPWAAPAMDQATGMLSQGGNGVLPIQGFAQLPPAPIGATPTLLTPERTSTLSPGINLKGQRIAY